MKFNHLTYRQMAEIYYRDIDRLQYIYDRTTEMMCRKGLDRYSRDWHDPQGYEYHIIMHREGDKALATTFLIAGYKGLEHFITLDLREAGGSQFFDLTNHFLLRFHNRVVASEHVEKVDARQALMEYHRLMVNDISLCVYNKKNEYIYATAEGLIFATFRGGILHYKTFVGLQQLKYNQTEAISMVYDLFKKYRHLDYVYHRGSIAFDDASKPLTDQLVALQPQLELLLTNYGRRKRKS